jgi:orotate phosphoribosyltransferase
VQEVNRLYGIPVVSIACLDDVLGYLRGRAELRENLRAVEAYRREYGIVHNA